MKILYINIRLQLNKAICLVAILFMYQCVYSQASVRGGTLSGNKLYYSAQTGEKSTLTGALKIFKSDSDYEQGSAHLNYSGPVIVSPTDFSMGTGQPMAETFTGAITVDPAGAPKPGYSIPASITGTYDIFYCCPMDLPCKPSGASFVGASWNCEAGDGPQPVHCHAGHRPPGGPHSMVEQKGTDGPFALTIFSIFDSIAGPGCVDPGATITYSAVGYPEGGDFLWSNGKKGTNITITINNPQVISVIYTINGVSYKASLDIKFCCKCNDIKFISPISKLSRKRIIEPENIKINLSDSVEIRSTGCRYMKPVWQVDLPAYLSTNLNDTTVFVRADKPCNVQVCATYPIENGPCKKCITVNIGTPNLPEKPKN